MAAAWCTRNTCVFFFFVTVSHSSLNSLSDCFGSRTGGGARAPRERIVSALVECSDGHADAHRAEALLDSVNGDAEQAALLVAQPPSERGPLGQRVSPKDVAVAGGCGALSRFFFASVHHFGSQSVARTRALSLSLSLV